MSDLAAGQGAAAQPSRPARIAVAVTFFCHGLYFASWTAHIPHVKRALGLTDSDLGLVLLAAPLGVVGTMALAVRVLPRLGSRRAVRLALVGYCVTGPLVGVAGSAPVLFASLLAWGAFQALLDVAMNTQGIMVERGQERRLMSSLHGFWSLGALAGAGIGAAAVGAGVALTPQMLILAVPILLAAEGLSLAMVDDVEAPAPAGPPAPRRRGLLLTPTILTLGAIALAGLVCEGAAADWAAVYLRTSLHSSAGYAGLGFTAFSLAMVTVRLAGNRLLRRWPPGRLLPALAGVATVGFAAGLAAGTPAAAMLGFAALGIGLGSIVPTVFSAAGRVPGVDAGAAVATVAAISYTGFVVGPALIGGLAGVLSLPVALGLLPVLTAAVAVLTAKVGALR